jgi:hypothetical protein
VWVFAFAPGSGLSPKEAQLPAAPPGGTKKPKKFAPHFKKCATSLDKRGYKFQNLAMKNWLKALLSQTAFSAWWILSASSTLSTFFLKGWSGKPRLVSAISAILGFAWANFNVFQKQESRISALNEDLLLHQAKTSQLKITPDGGSRYILVPVGDTRKGDFNGIYLEFRLMIENVGRRNSTVSNFQVEIVELQKTCTNLRSNEGLHSVQGRHCQHGLLPAQILSKTGIVRVDAESTTDHGKLIFFVLGVTLESFVNAGLRMHGEERKFGTLRCRLTITDTTNSSATADFELHED